ncbi:hypothetical protein DRN84_03745 [Candidatus Geothermarchaeota archaeon]|nr:MAG: hypothetical protein DRN87_04030 [Candidatus Geothermarchaeota archaeon]RLG61290.1 MAG: hypothetical protein DRN84_03745 [Candidatus Geothermarchaeota archaeon]
MSIWRILKNLVKNFFLVYILTGIFFLFSREYAYIFFILAILAMFPLVILGRSMIFNIKIYLAIFNILIILYNPYLLIPMMVAALIILRYRDLYLMIRRILRRYTRWLNDRS